MKYKVVSALLAMFALIAGPVLPTSAAWSATGAGAHSAIKVTAQRSLPASGGTDRISASTGGPGTCHVTVLSDPGIKLSLSGKAARCTESYVTKVVFGPNKHASPVVVELAVVVDSGHTVRSGPVYVVEFGAPGANTGAHARAKAKAGTTSAKEKANKHAALQIVTRSLPEARVGVAYSARLVASGGVGHYTWSVKAREVPSGLAFARTGQLGGIPAMPGTWHLRVSVRSAGERGAVAKAIVAIVVAPAKARTAPSASGASAATTTTTAAASTAASTVKVATDPNWSGYALTGGPFSSVSGTFTVTSLAGNTPATSYMSEAVAVDGWANSYLLEAGVQLSPSIGCNSSGFVQATYTQGTAYVCPWTMIGQNGSLNWGPMPALLVNGGDSVRVVLSEQSAGSWEISMTDLTTGQGWTTAVPYSGPAASAEWLAQSPGDTSVPCGQTSSGGAVGACPMPVYNPITFSALAVAPSTAINGVVAIITSQGGTDVSAPTKVSGPSQLIGSGFSLSPN